MTTEETRATNVMLGQEIESRIYSVESCARNFACASAIHYQTGSRDDWERVGDLHSMFEDRTFALAEACAELFRAHGVRDALAMGRIIADAIAGAEREKAFRRYESR